MENKKTLIGKYLNPENFNDEELKEILQQGTLEEIPINKIDNPSFHDRKIYSKASIAELAENIKEFGLAHPIVVRKKGRGRYERIIGFRRIEAYKYLLKDTIPAIVLDIPQEKAIALMLSENIQREDLNEYDKTYSQVQYLQYKFGFKSIEETLKFLVKLNNYNLGNIKNLTEKEKEIAKEISSTIEKITGKSFRNFIDRIRVLTVNPLIKEALIKNNWSYTIAIELQKLAVAGKLEELKELIKEAQENDYGYAQIKKRVEEILNKPKKVTFKSFTIRLSKLYPKLPEEKKEEINQKIREIEKILEEFTDENKRSSNRGVRRTKK